MKEASTDASQEENLEEEVSTETNPIEESEPSTNTDLSDKEKRVNELPEIYLPRVSFFLVLEVGSSTLESSPPLELKSPWITPEYACESSIPFQHPLLQTQLLTQKLNS